MAQSASRSFPCRPYWVDVATHSTPARPPLSIFQATCSLHLFSVIPLLTRRCSCYCFLRIFENIKNCKTIKEDEAMLLMSRW